MFLDRNLIPRVDAPIDLTISNGICYFAPGRPASRSFIPCGNAAAGHQSCCSAGDSCLSDGACYSQKFASTYLAGCTDSTYGDRGCPDKVDRRGSPWVSIVRCSDTLDIWQTCPQQGMPAELAAAESPCTCVGDPKTNVFTRPGLALDATALLPTATGLSVSFAVGRTPSAAATEASPGLPKATILVWESTAVTISGATSSSPAAVSGSTTSTSDATTVVAETFTPSPKAAKSTSLPPTTPSSPAHSATIIGGTTGGVSFIVLAAIALLFFLRRREPRAASSVEAPLPPAPKPSTASPSSPGGAVFTISELPTPLTPSTAPPTSHSMKSTLSTIPTTAPAGASLDLPRKTRLFGGISFHKARRSETIPRTGTVESRPRSCSSESDVVGMRAVPSVREGSIWSETGSVGIWRPRNIPADLLSIKGERSVESGKPGSPLAREFGVGVQEEAAELPAPVPAMLRPKEGERTGMGRPTVPPKGLGPCYEMPA